MEERPKTGMRNDGGKKRVEDASEEKERGGVDAVNGAAEHGGGGSQPQAEVAGATREA